MIAYVRCEASMYVCEWCLILGLCPLCVVQPNLEVAFLSQNPTSDSQEPISCLVTINKVLAAWLLKCIPSGLSKAEVSTCHHTTACPSATASLRAPLACRACSFLPTRTVARGWSC